VSFLVVSLVLLLVSIWALLILNSHDLEKLSLLNQYWSSLSLGIGILLIFLGIIYLVLFIGLIIGKFSVTLPHIAGVAVLYMPAAILLLGWLTQRTGIGLRVTPSGKFLSVVSYIALTWILLQHIEMAVEPEIPFYGFGILALAVSIIIFYASLSLLRYRKQMKSQMLLPLNLIPLLNGTFVTFTFISLAGISANLGLFLTHILSCLIGAIVILYFVAMFITEVRVYLR
jgi:hypothetical protein